MVFSSEHRRVTQKLEKTEDELLGILRRSPNWLLREKALLQARSLTSPSDEILLVLLDLACDRSLFLDERTLAVQALACLTPRRSPNADPSAKDLIIRKLKELAETPSASVFRQVLARAIKRIKSLDADCELTTRSGRKTVG